MEYPGHRRADPFPARQPCFSDLWKLDVSLRWIDGKVSGFTTRSLCVHLFFRNQTYDYYRLFLIISLFFIFISAMGDFHELKLGFRRAWSPVDSSSASSSSAGYYGSGASVGSQGTHSGARSTARPIPYRTTGATGGVTGGAGTSTGFGAGTGMAFSPATLLGTSPSPSRNNNIMLHSSGFSAVSTPSRAVPSTSSVNTHGGENSGCESAVEVGPGVRFCHVGVVYDGAFYIFGGYDGTQR